MTADRHAFTHCLVVEDLEPTADWLCEVVARTFPGIRIQRATNLEAGHQALAEQCFDLALLDLGLPDGSGLALIHALVAQQPDCLRVVTTIYTDDHHIFPALRAGAQGYLLKDQPAEQMSASLQRMGAGEPPLSPTIARRLLQVFSAEAQNADPSDRLTPRESETLSLVARGLKIAEVATHLDVTKNTAAGYVKTIYRKLNVSNRAEATIEAVRLGLVRTEL